MTFRVDPVVRLLDDGSTFRLLDAAVYDGREYRWVVPAGFCTDFATIPAVVAWLVPKLGRYTNAAIVHDYFCSVGISAGEISAREADGVFRRIMRENGVDPVTRWLMWTGVRWGALGNPARRPGWWRDAPAVLALSLLVAPVVLPTSLLAVGGRLVLQTASAVFRLFDR